MGAKIWERKWDLRVCGGVRQWERKYNRKWDLRSVEGTKMGTLEGTKMAR